MDIGNVYPTKNEIQRQYDQKQADMDKNLQKQMVFNENLQKVLKETQGIKPFNYDSVFKEKNELEKQHILLHVKFKALTMEKKMQICGGMQCMIQSRKIFGKVYKMYEKNEKLYKHMISQMEKVRPSFQYEPLIFIPKLKTLNEEEEEGNINGA